MANLYTYVLKQVILVLSRFLNEWVLTDIEGFSISIRKESNISSDLCVVLLLYSLYTRSQRLLADIMGFLVFKQGTFF